MFNKDCDVTDIILEIISGSYLSSILRDLGIRTIHQEQGQESSQPFYHLMRVYR